MVHVAWLELTVCESHPMLAPLSWNVTLPVGEPAPGEVTETVAVKVTD
jgi:hypothetical protein